MSKQGSNESAATGHNRHFVKVAAPSLHAGVGNALRQAFYMNGEGACLDKFEDLLSRLDRA